MPPYVVGYCHTEFNPHCPESLSHAKGAVIVRPYSDAVSGIRGYFLDLSHSVILSTSAVVIPVAVFLSRAVKVAISSGAAG